jgi:hypothetical protein
VTVRHEAPGLPADWLNGWLAAIGVTMLIPDARLRWTDDGVPSGVFETDQTVDLAKKVAYALPTPQTLARSVIARTLPGTEHQFSRNVTLAAFRERAGVERHERDGILAASVSDLSADLKPENLEHGAFDPPAPRGETLWSRATACAQVLAATDIAEHVRDTFNGSGRREALNGLGFDARRFPAGMHAARDVYADPVVELLAFAALPLFPTRGDGRRVRQRLWTDSSTRRGAFQWIAWRPALDRWGIDALFDLLPGDFAGPTLAKYRVIPYQPAARADTTRAYFAERVP